MSGVRVEVEGLAELIRALRNNANVARPMEQALRQIGLEASSASERKAPVDVGNLRRSITYEVDKRPLPTFVRIGTIGSDKPAYAAYMEYGTGLRHDHPSWPRRPHIVPGRVLVPWAARKARSRYGGPEGGAYGVARAITARGGLEPRRYLRGPFERSSRRYVRLIADALRRMRLDG
jgi:hypothetical protein